ncbi:trypsin-like peptidase domain-containing protein [Singulisphaera rosea]
MKRNFVAWSALAISTAALVSSRGVTRQVPAAPGIPVESQRTARSLSDAFVTVADFARPSVVQISVQRKPSGNMSRTPGQGGRNPFPGPNGPGGMNQKDLNDLLQEMMKRFNAPEFAPEHEQFGGGPAAGTGSGFVYDDHGHILTNNHVVSNAGKIIVTFHDGVEASATVVGTDPKSDVAVIKVDNTSYRPLPKGLSNKLRVGELVMAVGSPFGLSQSVTMGIISATERNNLGINSTVDSYESFIQTDAPINPGNSGGPLVDMDGHVIGINSAIMTGARGMGASGGNDGVGFAIPIDLASNVADKLIKDGKISRARIGVVIQPVSAAIAKALGLDPKIKGALVSSVVLESPAEKAGLKAGDVIVEYNGTPVVSVPSFRLNVAASDIGKPVGLKYYRAGKERSTEVVLASSEKVVFDIEKNNQESEEPDQKPEPAKTSVKGFGLELQPLTEDVAKGAGLTKETKGLVVSSVEEGSPADAAGIAPGMVITKVLVDKAPTEVSDVKAFQELADKSDDLTIYVQGRNLPGNFIPLSKAKKN